MKGGFFRFVTLSSTEKDFDKACDGYDKAFQTRGYSAHEVNNVRETVKWENKKDILIKGRRRRRKEREKHQE